MMDRAQWPVTTVSYFFSALPWRGSAIAPSPERKQQPVNFRLLSVKDFFTSISWNGQAQFAPAPEQGKGLSYQMPVRHFFSHFTWQGQPNIGVVPQIHISQSKAPDLDLSDLSDLF
jgi:hypothetical protein